MSIETVQTVDVFTPAKPAKATFVERTSVDSQLENAILTPGKQIVIFGHSGSGKTTLLANSLARLDKRAVTTRCTSSSTFESIVLSAFDKLNAFYTSEESAKQSTSLKSSLAADYKILKASLGADLSSEDAIKKARVLPPQLTSERLAEFRGAAKCCWVVEDFHKVKPEEKQKLAQSMKVFMDTAVDYPDVKVIALGAVDTAREVVQYDPEMRNRVSEIAVPLLTPSELKQILIKGEKLLNVRFGDLKEQIANYASGLGAVCHQLALNICLTAKIYQTSTQEFWISKEQLQAALESYVKDASDTLKSAFDKAIKRKRERKFDNTNLILKALTSAGSAGATYAEMLRTIQQDQADYPAGNLTLYLKELESVERGEIVRHDSVSGRYYFNDPLYLVYAQCLYVPAKGSDRVEMHLLGFNFKVDLKEFQSLRKAMESGLKKTS